MRKNNIPLLPLNRKRSLKLADGNPRLELTYYIIIDMVMGHHYERIACYITDLGYPIVLGLPWLTKYNVQTDYALRSITFHPEHCK